MKLDAAVHALRRGWSAIPIVVRPLLVLALLPIAAHTLLFRGGPSEPKSVRRKPAVKEPALPGPEELARLLSKHPHFLQQKQARCWKSVHREGADNPTAPVCRALVNLGYVDGETLRPTWKGRTELGQSIWDDGASVHLTIARPQLRAIVEVTPPPQERDSMRDTTRVDFVWAWSPTNGVGSALEISRHRRDMRGVAYLSVEEQAWVVVQLTLRDGAPDYTGMTWR